MKKLLLSVALITGLLTYAQQPGDIDPTFLPLDNGSYGYSINGQDIRAFAEQPDGKIILGGTFWFYNEHLCNNIVRINADGSIDDSFETGEGFLGFSDLSSSVDIYKIVLADDGKILVGGSFQKYNGVVQNGFVRLNPDGTLDEDFDLETVNFVNDLILLDDGEIIVAGGFSDGGMVKKFHSDGTVDETFATVTTNGTVSTIALQDDGKILAGGSFTTLTGIPRGKIGRLNANGTLDTSFNPGIGANSWVNDIAVVDEKIYIGGEFSEFDGTEVNFFTRLNSDGSLDDSYNIVEILNQYIYSITPIADGKLLITGSYSFDNGETPSVTILNSDGSADSNFTAKKVGSVLNAGILTDGNIIIVGEFYSYDDTPKIAVAKVLSNGDLDVEFNYAKGSYLPIFHVTPLPDGKIVVGGQVGAFNSKFIPGFTRIMPNGDTDSSFDLSAFENLYYAENHAVGVQPDGKIVITGPYDLFPGYICRLNTDGSVDESFHVAEGIGTDLLSVKSIVVLPDNKILIGGHFNSYDGVPCGNIVRLNSDGTVDLTFTTTGLAGWGVEEMRVLPDGKILIAGGFTSFDGITANDMVRLNADGTHDPTFDAGLGTESSVRKLAVDAGGKIYIGGVYETFNGLPCDGIVRLNADGSLDLIYETPWEHYDFKSLEVQPDGKLIVSFVDEVGEIFVHSVLARFNSDGVQDESFGINEIIGVVWDLHCQPDGKLLVAGDFSYYNDVQKHGIVRLFTGDSPTITVDDINATNFCAGTSVGVNITATGAYPEDNIFTLQLSDASGDFSNPVALYEYEVTIVNYIAGIIPQDIPEGTGYRVRVISSNGLTVADGSDNGSDITIDNPVAPEGQEEQTITTSDAGSASLADLEVTGENITWYQSEANAYAGTNSLPATTVVTSGLTYYATQTIDDCEGFPLGVAVEVLLGTENFTTADFTYYPNPVTNMLYIRGASTINEVSFYNIIGQRVLYTVGETNSADINVESLPSASYVVKIDFEGGTQTFRLIKM